MSGLHLVLLGICWSFFAVSAEAKITALQDWGGEASYAERENVTQEQRYQLICSNYGGMTKKYADEKGYTDCKIFSPEPSLICYKNCSCGSLYKYTIKDCRPAKYVLGGEVCLGEYYTECNCNPEIFPYKEGDTSCRTLSGKCKGDNGTYYRDCHK